MMKTKIKQNKFTKADWAVLDENIGGFIGNVHHLAGRSYEYLCYLKLMTVQDHVGNGHHKYINPENIPMKELEDNMRAWKSLLDQESWEYFFTRKIAWSQ